MKKVVATLLLFYSTLSFGILGVSAPVPCPCSHVQKVDKIDKTWDEFIDFIEEKNDEIVEAYEELQKSSIVRITNKHKDKNNYYKNLRYMHIKDKVNVMNFKFQVKKYNDMLDIQSQRPIK